MIDTGADDVLIPEYLGVKLGFLFPETDKVRLGGLQGSVRASARRINLLITDGETPLIWSARVWFHDGRPDRVLLGHLGFLEHFTATFDGRGHRVSLQRGRHRRRSGSGPSRCGPAPGRGTSSRSRASGGFDGRPTRPLVVRRRPLSMVPTVLAQDGRRAAQRPRIRRWRPCSAMFPGAFDI